MQALILAGGKGTRLREFTQDIPKGLIEIAGHSLLQYIIQHLALHGVQKVLIAGGYRCAVLSDYFETASTAVPVQVLDTGLNTNTAGRIKRVLESVDELKQQQEILICWSDALSDFDFTAMLDQHRTIGSELTIGAVHPPARFGELTLNGPHVMEYLEKPSQSRWISGGYFVVSPNISRHIEGDSTSWEYDVLPNLVANGSVGAYQHHGAWQCMDTYTDYQHLTALAQANRAFWPPVNRSK